MASLSEIFGKRGISLYQNESLDLDHYYQEPYQDECDELQDIDCPFETNHSRKIRKISFEVYNKAPSGFSYFMDGSRRTYKIGDIVLEGRKIYPIVVAQIRAGCTYRNENKKMHIHESINSESLLLLSAKLNDVDFCEIKERILRTRMAKALQLDIVPYQFDRSKETIPVNAAIAKANARMHDQEVNILKKMVASGKLEPNHMLIVDGPLQFICQDTGRPEFADLFYNVIGVSKSFDPMLPTTGRTKRCSTQIGAELLNLEYAHRTPVFFKENSRHRKFGCWYLRIRPRQHVSSPLEGIIKIEKMATKEENDGLNSDAVDTISMWLLEECTPTCYGRDKRWASHLYPVYLTETLIKASFESDIVFINNFKREF